MQSPLHPPGGSARRGLAMSQPGQKPAASPRPRRAAAARHAQEVSGAPVRGAARWDDPARGRGAPPLDAACLACCRVHPSTPSGLGRAQGSGPPSDRCGRWRGIPGFGLGALGVARAGWGWPASGKVGRLDVTEMVWVSKGTKVHSGTLPPTPQSGWGGLTGLRDPVFRVKSGLQGVAAWRNNTHLP